MNLKQRKKLIQILVSFVLFLFSFFITNPFYQTIFSLFLLFLIGFDVLLASVKKIFRGKMLDENFLMSIASIGAFCIGQCTEGVAVMLFYQVGEFFQSYAVDKSRKSIASLMDIRPDLANVYRDSSVVCVSPFEVKVGEIILVKPGEKVPLDGIVVEGTSFLNTRALTGESYPRKVSLDDEVFSGCVNQDGMLKVKVTKVFQESTVSKILELVENASTRKSKSENFIHKFARFYTPFVVLVAVLFAVFPPLFVPNASFSDYLYRALSFLVVSCPCALVISVPLSFFGGIGAASKKGILIKGSNYLEALSHTKMVVCDKTGTLTEGVFQVQDIHALSFSKEDVLRFSTYAEVYSNHPISLSLKEAYKGEMDESLVSHVKEIPGKGVEANVDGKFVVVGSEKLMMDHQIKFSKEGIAGTIVFVAIDEEFAGTIVIADQIKEDSYKAVKALKKQGISKIVMLTGDRQEVSLEVSQKLKLDEFHAELMPQDKVSFVEGYIKEMNSNGLVLFVGDGVNDAPVLALSDVGVSMGALGSDAAIEASDVVIMSDEPSKIAEAISISKKTMRIVRENIWFAILVKVLVLILSAFGISNMWVSVFADVGVTVLAILNALRVLYMKESRY